MVSEPTRITNSTASTIDLVFLSSPELLYSTTVLPPVGSSDHNSISVSLKLPSRHHTTNHASKSVWNYKKANISLAKELLKGLPLATESEDIDVFWNRWSTSFLSVMKRCIPTRSAHLNRSIPWIDSDIRHDIRLRERLYKRFKSSKCLDWYDKYKTIRNQVVSKIRAAKQVFFQNLASKRCDSKKFWSIMRSLKFSNSNHSMTLSNVSASSTSDPDKAMMFNSFFASCFNPKIIDPTYVAPSIPAALPPNLDITSDEVIMLLRRIKPHSASGPDAISAWMLRTFAEEAAPSIASLFNLSLSLGKLPNDWKCSNVVPIPKESSKSNVRFYRPISLLPIISKILERHVYSLLSERLATHNFLSSNQFGFQPGRNTTTPLLIATHKWHSALDNHQKVGCVFLDLKKAFDSVPHQALLNKLHSLHLPIHLFSWFSNYLKQRLQRVVLHGCTSPWLPVVSGVPQGSILGPILFLLYINGIFNVQLSKGSTLLVYADDILLFKPLSSPSDIQELQDDVDRICEWISLNHLTINVAKSKSMCISRRRSSMLSFTILFNGSPLEKVKCFKYLGLWITDDLTWSCHIESVFCRARRQLGFIYRFFSPHCDAGTILALYKAHVLPMLDYACIVC